MYNIVVHGGAWSIPKDMLDGHKKGVRKSLEIGLDLLKSGGEAEDAVEGAIAFMEDDETFDAGKGAFINRDGKVEHDAIMYHGNIWKFGSIMGSRIIKNPIKAARKLMHQDEMSIIIGPGADLFAREMDMEIVENNDFIIEREKKRWKEWSKGGRSPSDAFKDGTVGAVALDKDGNIVAGTSTGGTPYKHPGRVGDTPLPGAGAYANPIAGASATGYGEAIMRVGLSLLGCRFVGEGYGPRDASEMAVGDLERITGQNGGLVIMSAKGEMGFAFNTPRMARAYLRGDKIIAKV